MNQELIQLTKEGHQHEKNLTNMMDAFWKIKENVNQNKKKKSQLLNENEWVQCSYVAELQVIISISMVIELLLYLF